VGNQSLRVLYHSLVNSRVQYGFIAWGRAASCHLHSTANIGCFKSRDEVFEHIWNYDFWSYKHLQNARNSATKRY